MFKGALNSRHRRSEFTSSDNLSHTQQVEIEQDLAKIIVCTGANDPDDLLLMSVVWRCLVSCRSADYRRTGTDWCDYSSHFVAVDRNLVRAHARYHALSNIKGDRRVWEDNNRLRTGRETMTQFWCGRQRHDFLLLLIFLLIFCGNVDSMWCKVSIL